MKMKRIANNVALQTIGYVISGFTNVYIYVRENGYQKKRAEAVDMMKHIAAAWDIDAEEVFGRADE